MGFDQYHEPASELPQEVRTFARIIASTEEKCDAIGWYEQRISIEKVTDAKKIMQHAQEEEFLYFSMDPEFLLMTIRKPTIDNLPIPWHTSKGSSQHYLY